MLLAGCDKSLPGMLMAAARAGPGCGVPLRGLDPAGHVGEDVTIIDAFEAAGACLRGQDHPRGADAIEQAICPARVLRRHVHREHDGVASPRRSAWRCPAAAAPAGVDAVGTTFARASGEAVVEPDRAGITARQILTKEAFENAITVVMALGGSTNAVLHLLAIAHEARGRRSTSTTSTAIGDRTRTSPTSSRSGGMS